MLGFKPLVQLESKTWLPDVMVNNVLKVTSRATLRAHQVLQNTPVHAYLLSRLVRGQCCSMYAVRMGKQTVEAAGQDHHRRLNHPARRCGSIAPTGRVEFLP